MPVHLPARERHASSIGPYDPLAERVSGGVGAVPVAGHHVGAAAPLPVAKFSEAALLDPLNSSTYGTGRQFGVAVRRA